MNFAWTPGTGAYKHYPPYVNLTGNRLTVRGSEDLSGEHPMMGATVSIDLPYEVIAELSAALQSERASMEGEIERLREAARVAVTAIRPLVDQGEDAIWRPAVKAMDALTGALNPTGKAE